MYSEGMPFWSMFRLALLAFLAYHSVWKCDEYMFLLEPTVAESEDQTNHFFIVFGDGDTPRWPSLCKLTALKLLGIKLSFHDSSSASRYLPVCFFFNFLLNCY